MRLIQRLHSFTHPVRNTVSPTLYFLLTSLRFGLLSRLGFDGRVDYTDRNCIEKRFQTLKMRIGRFHNSWVGSRASAREWLEQFIHYYNRQRPYQSPDG